MKEFDAWKICDGLEVIVYYKSALRIPRLLRSSCLLNVVTPKSHTVLFEKYGVSTVQVRST